MKLSNIRGEVLAIIAAILQASVLVFWKHLLSFFPKPVLMTYWFGLAAVILFSFTLIKKQSFSFDRKLFFPLLVFGLLSSLTVFLLMTGVGLVGASLTSFIMQTTGIFALFYSLIALKEKFRKWEIFGIILIIIGLFYLNWNAEIQFTTASLLIVLAALSQSTNHFMAKKLLDKVSKSQLNLMRVTTIMIVGLLIALFTGETFSLLNMNNLLILIAGVLIGPIFIYVFYYESLKKTQLAKASVLRSISPIFTFVLAFIFLGETINPQQTIAVVIILAGSYFIFKK